MFNRQPYNRGKFNRPSTGLIGNSGIALMVLGSNEVKAERTISASTTSRLTMGQQSKITLVKYAETLSDLMMKSNAKITKVYIVTAEDAYMVLNTKADQSIAGESFIILDNLGLGKNDELMINTCDMTITINGNNAMEHFDSESDFFNFLSGINTLVYSDTNASRDISFDVIWKDRWL